MAEARKKREQEEQQIRDLQRRERTIILEKLEQVKKTRAIEILNILKVKGIKKIGKEKVKDLEANTDKIDYDVVIDYYQSLLQKEREQIEEDKKKKLKEIELWTRATREEEKLAVEKYAKEHGEKEIELIRSTIMERQSKELKEKEALSSAKDVFRAHMEKMMEVRNQQWVEKKKEFKAKKMGELKADILELAETELKKYQNKVLAE